MEMISNGDGCFGFWAGFGTLAGLVSITSLCHAVMPVESLIVGAVGGMVAIMVSFLLVRYQTGAAAHPTYTQVAHNLRRR